LQWSDVIANTVLHMHEPVVCQVPTHHCLVAGLFSTLLKAESSESPE